MTVWNAQYQAQFYRKSVSWFARSIVQFSAESNCKEAISTDDIKWHAISNMADPFRICINASRNVP